MSLLLTGSLPKLPAAGGYSANAVDNTGAVYGTTTGYTGPGASKTGTISLWHYNAGATWPSATEYLLEFRDGSSNIRLELYSASSGRLLLNAKNSSGTDILTYVTATSSFTAQTWHHSLISWDLAASTCLWYVDDSDLGGSPTTTDDSVADFAQCGVLATRSGSSIGDWWVADVYVDAAYLALGTASNRRNFIDAGGKPVDISSYGSPHMELTGDENNFFTNGGSGGNLTETGGSLAAASSSPSD